MPKRMDSVIPSHTICALLSNLAKPCAHHKDVAVAVLLQDHAQRLGQRHTVALAPGRHLRHKGTAQGSLRSVPGPRLLPITAPQHRHQACVRKATAVCSAGVSRAHSLCTGCHQRLLFRVLQTLYALAKLDVALMHFWAR